jgi:DNA-binding transcriptional ArsR family regulator
MSSIEIVNADLVATANYLRMISHPSRLAIALLLLDGSCPVSVMESSLGLRQPNLSQHLGLLRDANILTSVRQAKSVVYELSPGPVRDLVEAIARARAAPRALTSASAAGHEVAPQPAIQQGADQRSGNVRPESSESDDALVFAHVYPLQRKGP